MTTYPNSKETLKVIEKLVSIPSPSGNTEAVIQYVEKFLNNLGLETEEKS